MSRSEIEKDFATLEQMRRSRMNFSDRICAASAAQNAEVLDGLRLDSMYEFAEFYFTIAALGFKDADDIAILAEMHNQRIDDLLRNADAMRHRKLRKDRLLEAIFTADTRPRLEQIWRTQPGALDQSNLARFLIPQMSKETSRTLCVAAQAAGFLTRTETVFGAIVVTSTGVMEEVFGQCLREMRLAISSL